MLKGVPPILSPEMLLVLAEMGHGDDLVLADCNFPAESNGQRVIRADGHGVCPLLEAILKLFPVDTFVPQVAFVMQPVNSTDPQPAIWNEYRSLLRAAEGWDVPLTQLPREEFYAHARSAYAIVATSERKIFGNLILKKGIVPEGK